ncbi:MAG: hypothetical protein SFV81_30665 [Pirellulaceae bacterium]|nr:hypothetical protein [Pirellulaceae bacterium]
MVRINKYFTSLCTGWVVLAALSLAPQLSAQVKTAYELLPDSTQAVVWIPNTADLIKLWDTTQLAQLAADDAVKPFWDDQRQEIEKRFLDAGWRLNIKPQDLADITEGQFSIAWIERTEPKKPFALALIVDVVKDRAAVDKLMERIDAELVKRKAKKQTLTFDGESINHYSITRPGELLTQETYYSIVDRQLLSADDEQLVKDLIARAKGKPTGKTLEKDVVFTEGREQLQPSHKAQAEYFVRPIGFAKILKAIGGKRRSGNTDLLAVLANQGFSAIKCVCGELQIGSQEYDIQHRGFTLTDGPLPKSAGVLDFPNKAKSEIPNFVTSEVSSLLVGFWNSQEAFWKVEGLVDEIAGQEGVFKEVIKGIKDDPTGPKIDIKQDVLPYLTNDIFSISDTVDPITTDSHRNLIALRLNAPAKIKAVLRQAMKNEPGAQLVEGPDEIWRKSADSETGTENDPLSEDFGGDFGAAGNAPPAEGAGGPWVKSWAIAVYGDYFMFASHVEMIKDAIAQAKSGKPSPLIGEPSCERIQAALTKVFGEDPNCFRQIVRSDLSYRMQYELFRSGELDQSESMLAGLLDRLLQNNAEIKPGTAKKINGARLPKFEEISHYLQPSGMVVQTKAKGWAFGSLLLASPNAKPQPKPEAELTGSPETRVSNAEGGEKR